MKQTNFLARCLGIVLLFCTTVEAQNLQDTIFSRVGVPIPAIVLELNQDNIRYRKAGRPDGTIHSIYRCNVKFIRLRDGSLRQFEPCAANIGTTGTPLWFFGGTLFTPPVGGADTLSFLPKAEPIQFFPRTGGFYVNNRAMSPTLVREMMRRDDRRAFDAFVTARHNNNTSWIMAILSGVALGTGGGLLLAKAAVETEDGVAKDNSFGRASVIAFGVAVASGGLSAMFNYEARNKYASAVAFYNEQFNFPTLGCRYKPSLHLGLCSNGMGFTLKF